MAHRWRVRVRGNIAAPYEQVASWWIAEERVAEWRQRLERRLGDGREVMWREGRDGADRWLEARWTTRRFSPVRARLTRHAPQFSDEPHRQLRATAGVTVEHETRRGASVVTHLQGETLLVDRGRITELQFWETWVTTGTGFWRQLWVRHMKAGETKGDIADKMLRCESSISEHSAGANATTSSSL